MTRSQHLDFWHGLRPSRINCLFMNMLRGYLWSLPELSELRRAYANAMSASVSILKVLGKS